MKWALTLIGFAGMLVALCAPWSGRGGVAVNVIGSTSVQPFAEMLSQEFNRLHPENSIDVQGGGSTAGIQAAKEGVADIGMCSRELKEDEKRMFVRIPIARDGLAVVVHPSNPVNGLQKDQIRKIFAGEITHWSDVGGPSRAVRLITREEGSGTREAFQKLVMGHSRISPAALTQESNGAVKELIRHDPSAVGYMSLGLVGGELKAISIDGRPPTVAQVTNAAQPYPLVRPFLFITKGPPNPRAQQFIDFVLSPHGQQMLAREGLVGVK